MLLSQSMKKKRSLTLLEVVIAMLLLGILLTGLFNTFRQGLKKNIAAKELKQKVLQLELFQQKLRSLFAEEEGVWIEKHPDLSSLPLFIEFQQKTDPDFKMCGETTGMLYLNGKKELCLASWSEKGNSRIETLLDNVDAFKCRLFDPKKGTWTQTWPKKKEGSPAMAAVDLTWNGKEIPFVFFLSRSNEKITYPGQP